jgi:hypothetical protein
MTRIAPENMTTLIPASDAKTVAETAAKDLEEMQVAHLINEAANCGQTSVVYARPISAVLKTKLTGLGYTFTTPTPIAKSGDATVIHWS